LRPPSVRQRFLKFTEEFAGLDFHSTRLGERFIRTTGTLHKQQDKSIREESADRAEAKAIYRMPGNESFDREGILSAHREATIGRMAGHGGTDYSGRSGYRGANCNTRLKTQGIGYISDKTRRVSIHGCLAGGFDGLVLGVSGQSGYKMKKSRPRGMGRQNGCGNFVSDDGRRTGNKPGRSV
jgi:hypothetical protein